MKHSIGHSKLLFQLLFQGIWVELIYSIVVVLVITSMFSTPLILGSIKNKVYKAVKEQIERENNAREITIQRANAEEGENPLDQEFLSKLQVNFPHHQIVGNYKKVIRVQGPAGSKNRTMETLIPNDLRSEALQIHPQVPSNFGLRDVILSDSMGQLLYGKTAWEKGWEKDASKFLGAPLTIDLGGGQSLQGKFQVVARQRSPGLKIYLNQQAGMLLEKYSMGLGATELGLPLDEDLIRFGLPKLETHQCILEFPREHCSQDEEQNILKRLRAESYQVQSKNANYQGISSHLISFIKIDELEGEVRQIPIKSDCETRLPHHVESCSNVGILPQISWKTQLLQDSGKTHSIALAPVTFSSYELLPQIHEMENRYGGSSLNFENDQLWKKGIELIAPHNQGVQIGETVTLQAGNQQIPGMIFSYYQCSRKNQSCPFYASPKAIFRLKNVASGQVSPKQRDPLIFSPTNPQVNYDEILFYANEVEEVKPLFQTLRTDLSNYTVMFQQYAIQKLERQDQRLALLFTLTVFLSVIFIILAVGALAKINIDKRKRQMAQLFLLGYSKKFVGVLLVGEYILLTVLASLGAIGIGAGIFGIARYYLQRSTETKSKDFNTIIQAMTIDLTAFANVFLIVVSITIFVASVAAYYAGKSDPVELLD